MATQTKTFTYNAATQALPYTAQGGSWAAGGTVGVGTLDTTSTYESTNDTDAGNGGLRMRVTGKNQTGATSFWEWTGTWENLGVPAGSVITQVNVQHDWAQPEFTTGAAGVIGPSELRDSGSTLLATIQASGATPAAAQTTWSTRTGTAQNVPSAQQASSTTIKLRIGAVPKTGNSNSAAVSIGVDRVIVTITYTPTTPVSQTAGAPLEGPQKLTDTSGAEPVEATQKEAALCLGCTIDAPQKLTDTSGAAPADLVQKVVVVTLDPVAAEQRLAVTKIEQLEGQQKLTGSDAAPLESVVGLTPVSQTAQLALEWLKAIAQTAGSEPAEAVRPLAATVVEPSESLLNVVGGSVPTFSASATTPRPGSNVSSLAVNLPTYAAGDHVFLLVFGDYLLNSDTASATGWTLDGRVSNGQRILFVFHRQMDGSEGSTVTVTFNNGFERPMAVAATYTGASAVEASIVTGQNTPANTWSLGSITTTGSNRKAIAFLFSASGNAGTDFTTVDGGAVKRVDVTDATGPGGSAEAAMIADLDAPTAGSYSMSGSISSFTLWEGVLLALEPSQSRPTTALAAEASLGIAQTVQSRLDSALALRALAAGGLEWLRALVASGSAPIEHLTALTRSGSDPAEASQLLAQLLADPAETTMALTRTGSTAAEAVRPLTASTADPAETLARVVGSAAARAEALQALAAAATGPAELVHAIRALQPLPLEAVGVVVIAVSQTAQLVLEAVAAAHSTGTTTAETVGQLQTSTLTSAEALRATTAAAAAGLEALHAIAAIDMLDIDAATVIRAAAASAAEPLAALADLLEAAAETLLEAKSAASVVLEELAGVAAAAGLSLEQLVDLSSESVPAFETGGLLFQAAALLLADAALWRLRAGDVGQAVRLADQAALMVRLGEASTPVRLSDAAAVTEELSDRR